MTYRTKYISGEYNVICDICNFNVKASQTRVDRRPYSLTKGLRVCLDDWDDMSPSLGPAPRIHDEMRPVRDARPDVKTGNETFVVQTDFGWEQVSYTVWELWGASGEAEFWENIESVPGAEHPDADDLFD